MNNGTERPLVPTPKMRVLDVDEMRVFMREVISETQRVAILCALFTGLRIGELLAPEVTDINTKTQSIEVCKNIIRVQTKAIDTSDPNIEILGYMPEKKTHLIIQNTPKTEASIRDKINFVPFYGHGDA